MTNIEISEDLKSLSDTDLIRYISDCQREMDSNLDAEEHIKAAKEEWVRRKEAEWLPGIR